MFEKISLFKRKKVEPKGKKNQFCKLFMLQNVATKVGEKPTTKPTLTLVTKQIYQFVLLEQPPI